MLHARKRSLASACLLAVGGLLGGLVPAVAADAAAPPAQAMSQASSGAVVTSSANASLTGLAISAAGSFGGLSPAFSPAVHDYQQIVATGTLAYVTPALADAGASAVVELGSGTYTVPAGGTAQVPLSHGRNDLRIVVTAADGVTTDTYRTTVWKGIAPAREIASASSATLSAYGGSRFTITLKNAPMPGECTTSASIDGVGTWVRNETYDAAAGTSTLYVEAGSTAGYVSAVRDLTVTTNCARWDWWWGGVTNTVVAKQAVTFTSQIQVDSAEVPAVVTSGSEIVLRGPGLTSRGALRAWIEGGSAVVTPYTWGYTGEKNFTAYVEYPWGDEEYGGSGPRTLKVGVCPSWQIDDTCNVVWSKQISWRSPAPEDVSFSPSAGPVAGGTKLRIKGRFLGSVYDGDMYVTVGGKRVDDVVHVRRAAWEGDTYESYRLGYDLLEITVPPGTAAGAVPVTVVTKYGTTAARGTFTYAPKPVVSAVAPSTVAASGGSVVTVTGTGFGTAGRPTVVINGEKSPYVERVSDTKLRAVVPPGGTPGPVELTVASPQGGGISLPATLTLATPTTTPAVTTVSPVSAAVGSEVTLTGSGFGAAGTVGVSVDGVWARVTSSTTTTVTFEVPAVDTPGVKTLQVGSVTGLLDRPNGFTVLPDRGIAAVSPASIPSYATGNAAKVTLTGYGFGTTGTVKVGDAAAVAYTATNAGTSIAGVTVPTSASGAIPIVVTPAGATTPLRSSVRVVEPRITYVGPDPHNGNYNDASQDAYSSGAVFSSPTTGAVAARIQGSGFGTTGTLTVGGAPAPVTSWSDTVITFAAPARAAGDAAVVVRPSGATLTATRTQGIRYVAVAARPTISGIASTQDLGHDHRAQFHPLDDVSDSFTITGSFLAGTSAAATRVVVSENDKRITVVPTSVTATSVVFAAPRSFGAGGWHPVTVVTDLGDVGVGRGVEYLVAGATVGISPAAGSCLRAPVAGTGGVTHQPSTITVVSSPGIFGSSGKVTIGGVEVTPQSWAAGSVVVSTADLPADLAQPWGPTTIVVTPDDTSKSVQTFGFSCTVPVSVTTTVNGGTSQVTVPAGTPYTLGHTTSGFVGVNPFTATLPGGYEYVSRADFDSNGFNQHVRAGAPSAAGDWMVRVSRGGATYDAQKYTWADNPSPVRVTITGTPITVTPTSVGGASIVYKGQLGAGAGGPTDFQYTPSLTTDPITKVVWEYRNSSCDNQGSNMWIEGLPKDVAVSSQACGGDGSTQVAWDVRVKSFEMKSTGTDRAPYYEATLPSVRVTITPRPVTVAAARADKVWDGTTTATVGELTFTNAVLNDDVRLKADTVQATFADAAPGANKPVTLAADVALDGAARHNYTLTNARPTIVGTIRKADASLALSASPTAVILSAAVPIEVTATVKDRRTNAAPDVSAGMAPVVLASQTPTICTISGTTVTAKAAGTCVVTGRQSSSVNYNATTAASDSSSTTETVEITVFPAARAISVVADDLTVAVGDSVDPSAQITGLFDGDEVTGVAFDYYQGATLLPGAPSDPGTYKVVPKGGTLQAAGSAAYTNPTEFKYVAGTLVVTALPPTIATFSPASGYVTGGTQVTVTGTRLDTVKSVRFGAVTLRGADLSVNEDGTRLQVRSPKVSAAGPVDVVLVAGTATAQDVFTYLAVPTPPAPPKPPAPTGPVQLNLDLALKVDSSFVGAQAQMTGKGLKPSSAYRLEMHSRVVVLATGTTDSLGRFSQAVRVPKKACVSAGLHELVLVGTAPNGTTLRSSRWIVLDDTCTTRAASKSAPVKGKAVRLHGFLFDNKSARLRPEAKATLTRLSSSLKSAKVITIIGYTQTQKTSPASIAANKKLAKKRAANVAAYLRSKGVRSKIVIVGRGPVDPVSKRDQRLNRRVVIEATW